MRFASLALAPANHCTQPVMMSLGRLIGAYEQQLYDFGILPCPAASERALMDSHLQWHAPGTRDIERRPSLTQR
jgi:hypothetical protein